LPSGIVYNSRRSAALHGAYGYFSDRASIIPNGYVLPPDVTPKSGPPRTFGIAGRLHPDKDYGNFFRAAARASQGRRFRFVAAGRGLSPGNPEAEELRQAAGLNSELIDLRGEVDDMSSFYKEIDALVLSSRTEAFPNVVAEAMSYGKPVIATDVGDAAVIVGDTGLIVPPRDPEALADAMCRLADVTPEDYMSLARRARERIGTAYSLSAVVEMYERMIERRPQL
jgi:glycosyltransferase involved in cell wall biosynthesis